MEQNENEIRELVLLESLLLKMQKAVLSYIEYRDLQYLLIKYENKYRKGNLDKKIYPLCGTPFYDDKILFITDSHIGNSESENLRVMEAAYNEGINQNIKTAIHLGDLIEATPFEQDKSQSVVEVELFKATSIMPEQIKTWLLLGNHEYSAIRTYPEIIDKIFTNYKLEVLGMGRCLVFWNGDVIGVNHQIKQLEGLDKYNPDSIIELSGHVHYYQVDSGKRNVYIPPICKNNDDVAYEGLKKYNYCLGDSRKAFVIGSHPDRNILLFEVYGIDHETSKVKDVSEKIEINRQSKIMRLYRS